MMLLQWWVFVTCSLYLLMDSIVFFSPLGVFHPNSLCIMAQSFIPFQLDSTHISHHAHFLEEGFYSAYVAGFRSLKEAFFIWFWVMKSLQEVEIESSLQLYVCFCVLCFMFRGVSLSSVCSQHVFLLSVLRSLCLCVAVEP